MEEPETVDPKPKATNPTRARPGLVRAASCSSAKFESPFDANLLEARQRSQRERLWEIFASYALQLSCEDPTRMRTANVVRLLQDCGVIDAAGSDQARAIEKEVAIICESFLKSYPRDREGAKKLTFPTFLALLKNFARMSGDQDSNRAYDSLVRTCLERQKKTRPRVPIAKDLQECRKLLTLFDDPLRQLFAFYAAQTHSKLEKMEPKAAHSGPDHMGYAECVAFGRKYGVISHGVLTTTEFAALYIDSLPKAPQTELDRVLTFDSFCELLVRLAWKASRDEPLTADRKLKGIFQVMWLATATSSTQALKIADVLKSNRLDVTRHFRLHFEKFWKKERYENYLTGDLGGGVPLTPTHSMDSHGMTPPAPARATGPRRLSLCVQTTTSANGEVTRPTLQRRFTVHATSSTSTPPPPPPPGPPA